MGGLKGVTDLGKVLTMVVRDDFSRVFVVSRGVCWRDRKFTENQGRNVRIELLIFLMPQGEVFY